MLIKKFRKNHFLKSLYDFCVKSYSKAGWYAKNSVFFVKNPDMPKNRKKFEKFFNM